jgi:DNA-binding HxlR family transcriptional regulator
MDNDQTISAENDLFTREIFMRIADKWTLLVIDALEQGTLRFSELQRKIWNISQKMLTQTLREMERDGFVVRKIYPTVPPKVEYTLTELGLSLSYATCSIWEWSYNHFSEVKKHRLKNISHTSNEI